MVTPVYCISIATWWYFLQHCSHSSLHAAVHYPLLQKKISSNHWKTSFVGGHCLELIQDTMTRVVHMIFGKNCKIHHESIQHQWEQGYTKPAKSISSRCLDQLCKWLLYHKGLLHILMHSTFWFRKSHHPLWSWWLLLCKVTLVHMYTLGAHQNGWESECSQTTQW